MNSTHALAPAVYIVLFHTQPLANVHTAETYTFGHALVWHWLESLDTPVNERNCSSYRTQRFRLAARWPDRTMGYQAIFACSSV